MDPRDPRHAVEAMTVAQALKAQKEAPLVDRTALRQTMREMQEAEDPELAAAIQQLEAQHQQRIHRVRRNRTIAGAVLGAFVALQLLWIYITYVALSPAWAEVIAKQHAYQEALDRQVRIQKIVSNLPPSSENTAELVGSENRVSIARNRLRSATDAYENAASAFPHSLYRSVLGFPKTYNPDQKGQK